MSTFEFKPSHGPSTFRHLEVELTMLARINHDGIVKQVYRPAEEPVVVLIRQSLARFGLIELGKLTKAGAPAGWGWRVSETGIALLAELRQPVRHGCQCEHSIVLPCVCGQRTYCPNLQHDNNGCHGTHD